MSGIPFDDWVDEEYFYEEFAKMHKINPKLDVIQILFDQFRKIRDDRSYCPLNLDLSEAERRWLMVELSAQIVALSMELTDDLAFVCEGYSKALNNGNHKVVTYIAGFQRDVAVAFYQRVSEDSDQAALAMGFDPGVTPKQDKERLKELFSQIRGMREQFWKFYNSYKHGQSATPIVTGVEGSQKWGLYRIPDVPRVDAGKLHTQGSERFIDSVTYASNFVELAKTTWSLWLDVVKRQFPRVFGKSL